MSDQKTHWKKLTNPNYIGAHDLTPGQELKITLDTVSNEMVTGPDGTQTQCVVVKIKGAKKPMILNKTNMKIIAKLVGSNYVEDWAGHSIILYAAKVKAFGELVEALRVKNVKA